MTITLQGYYLQFALIVLWPMAVIFRRAGFSPWWSLLLLVPPSGLILCMMTLAMRKWPARGKEA